MKLLMHLFLWSSLFLNAILLFLISDTSSAPNRGASPGNGITSSRQPVVESHAKNRISPRSDSQTAEKIAAEPPSTVQLLKPLEPGASTATIALRMMEQGLPEQSIATFVAHAINRSMEREHIAGLSGAGQRLRRWHQALSSSSESQATVGERLKSESQLVYDEIVRALPPAGKSRFDESSLGRTLRRRFEQAK